MQRRKSFFRWLTDWLLLSMLGIGILGGAGLSVRAAPIRATLGDVIISEVAWGGTIAADEDEWIELHNFSSDISLDQWRITSEPLPFNGATPNINITISDSGMFLTGDYYLLEREIDTVVNNEVANQIYTGPGNLLDDSGETLYLYAPNGLGGYDLIDTVNSNGGTWPAGLPSGYGSMERYENSFYPDSDSIWVTNTTTTSGGIDYRGDLIHGSPKMENWASGIPPISITLITSIDPAPSIPGLAVKVNVSVTGGPTIPTGSVAIIGADTNCTISLSSGNNGIGSCNVIFSSTGKKTLTATFTPTSNHTSSIDTEQHDVVTAISTTTTITNISPDPTFIDEDVTVSVKVDPATGNTKPTGTVNITGASTNCKFTLNNGEGNCKVRFTSVGVKTLKATYEGVGAFMTSQDTETVDSFFPSTTTITTDNPDPSITNQQVTVIISVTGASSVPTGSVDITGASSNCSLVLNTNGTGSCLLNFLSSGTKTIRATYNGDDIYYISTDTETHIVSFSSSGSSGSSGSTGSTAPDPILGISEFLPRPGHDWNNDGYVDVFDEFIEIINAGSVDVNLSSYKVDDEKDLGSSPYTLPNIILKPGERTVFYASETGILLSDAGDTVRLLKGSTTVVDAYTYGVVRYPDQSWCRIPDRLGYWNKPCFPTPNNPNALTGTLPLPPKAEAGYHAPVCLLPDTTPDVFVYAECEESGNEIWNRQYWDGLDLANFLKLYEPNKWETVFE